MVLLCHIHCSILIFLRLVHCITCSLKTFCCDYGLTLLLQIWLTVAAVLGVALSAGACYGIGLVAGLLFGAPHNALIFLLLGKSRSVCILNVAKFIDTPIAIPED